MNLPPDPRLRIGPRGSFFLTGKQPMMTSTCNICSTPIHRNENAGYPANEMWFHDDHVPGMVSEREHIPVPSAMPTLSIPSAAKEIANQIGSHGAKVVNPGHSYVLPNFENPESPGQKLQFIEKHRQIDEDAERIGREMTERHKDEIGGLILHARPVPLSPEQQVLKTIHDGTTNEAVLDVLIDRLQFLNAKFPCRENAIALTHLETALLFLEKRTRDRVKRGVEGMHKV